MTNMMDWMRNNIDGMIFSSTFNIAKEFDGTRVYDASTVYLKLRVVYLCGMLKSPRRAELRMIDYSRITAGVKYKLWGKIQLTISTELFNTIFACALHLVRNIENDLKLDLNVKTGDIENYALLKEAQSELLHLMKTSRFCFHLDKQDWRNILAYTITCISLDYIVAHEAAHVMNGHPAIPSSLRSQPWIQQLLESQADDFATLRLLMRERLFKDPSSDPSKPISIFSPFFIFSNQKDMLNIYLTAIILSFAVIGDENDQDYAECWHHPELKGMEYRTYPSSSYRLWRARTLLVTPLQTNPELPPVPPLSFATDGIIDPLDLLQLVRIKLKNGGFRGGSDNILPSMDEDQLKKYDRLLMSKLAPVAKFEREWRSANLDPSKPPPSWPPKI